MLKDVSDIFRTVVKKAVHGILWSCVCVCVCVCV